MGTPMRPVTPSTPAQSGVPEIRPFQASVHTNTVHHLPMERGGGRIARNADVEGEQSLPSRTVLITR